MALKLVKVATESDMAQMSAMLDQCGDEGGKDPYFFGEPMWWLIRDGEATVGFTGIHSVDWIARRCRGSLWIAPEYRRRKYGSEALDARNRLLFDELNMNRIEWVVPETAHARLDMAQARGEHLEGRLREVVYQNGEYRDYLAYSLLKSDGPPQDDYMRSD